MNKDEDNFVEELTIKLQELVEKDKDNYIPKIKISHHVNILKDITGIPERGKWKLVFGAAEQDIVIYLDEKNYKIEIPFDHGDITKAKGSFPSKSNSNKKHFPFCVIPYVIWEVKCGNLTTHQIAFYSSVAQQIKDKFPDVMYNLLVLNARKTDQTLNRHGKYFDIILKKEKSSVDDISREVYEVIKDRMKFNGILQSE